MSFGVLLSDREMNLSQGWAYISDPSSQSCFPAYPRLDAWPRDKRKCIGPRLTRPVGLADRWERKTDVGV